MSRKSKVFFPSLNGLRFIAAFVVIIHHLEQIKYLFGLPNIFFKWHFIKIVGELGVTLFFTLSGFLITYLLLTEKERFGTVFVKEFYIRRILRIWPLYYLLIILGLFVLPNLHFFDIPVFTELVPTHFKTKILFYFILFPNVINCLYAYMPYIAQTWSIGIEEQFYIVWPWIMKKTSNYFTVMLFIIFGLLITTSVLSLFASHAADISLLDNKTKLITFIWKFLAMLRISCMAIGALGALLLYNLDLRILRFFFKPMSQIIIYTTVFLMLMFGVEFPFAHHEIYSVFFILIILNLAANPDTIFSLEHKAIDYLGKISYSIYMWHSIAIIAALHVAQFINPNLNDTLSNIVYYVLTFVGSFILSALSYEYFESPFLKFKHLFAKVQSGNFEKK